MLFCKKLHGKSPWSYQLFHYEALRAFLLDIIGGLVEIARNKGVVPAATERAEFPKSNLRPTSTILVPTGDQDLTVHFTQIVWMAVAPPILVANQI